MARIEGQITIGRPVELVFDYVTDQTNEPLYNPKMVGAEKETAGPIGKGTRFRSAVRSGGRTAEMLIENTGYDRPRLLTSTTTMKQACGSLSSSSSRMADGAARPAQKCAAETKRARHGQLFEGRERARAQASMSPSPW